MRPSRSSSVWWLVLVSLAAALLCAPFFRLLFFWGDEGVLLHEAELILQGKKIYADFFQFLPPRWPCPHRGMVQRSRRLLRLGPVACGRDHSRNCLFHLPSLPAGLTERAALRHPRDRLGDDVHLAVDADQPSLVRDAPIDRSHLGGICEPRPAAAPATMAADGWRGGWRSGDVCTKCRGLRRAGRHDRVPEFTAEATRNGCLRSRLRPRARSGARISACRAHAHARVR